MFTLWSDKSGDGSVLHLLVVAFIYSSFMIMSDLSGENIHDHAVSIVMLVSGFLL